MDSTKTLPEQILETSHAFTHTLEMENKAFQGQLNGIVNMTIDALQKLIALCREASSLNDTNIQVEENLADLKQRTFADLQQAVAQAGKTPAPALQDAAMAADPSQHDLNAAAVQSVSLSYKNAVTAQQQAYVTQQAATTMVITTLLSTVTATVANAVKQEVV